MAEQPKAESGQKPLQPFMTMEQVMEMIKALREPSEEQKQKKAAEEAHKKEEAQQSIQFAEQELNNLMGLHQACNHRNERTHTFVAQNCGDGNTVAICQICRCDYKWRTTSDQARQGVNLLEYRGLTEAHLLAWEKQFPATGSPPDRIKLLTRAGKPAIWQGSNL